MRVDSRSVEFSYCHEKILEMKILWNFKGYPRNFKRIFVDILDQKNLKFSSLKRDVPSRSYF
jgi:hypothetical protein